MGDPFGLHRFVTAQDNRGTYDQAVKELRRGRKTSHWMWYVFPQLAGLGQSVMSRQYAISSLAEAQAYLQHPVLGPRLVDCAAIVASTDDRSAEQIFGLVDAQKLLSSMTLFHYAAPAAEVFAVVVDRYFGGQYDERTEARLPSAEVTDIS